MQAQVSEVARIREQIATEYLAAQQLAAIQHWPHWQEIGLVAAKEYGITQEQYEVLLPEYQRFLLLAMTYHGMGMFSRQIDNIWHSHILSTLKYQEFATVGEHCKYTGCCVQKRLPSPACFEQVKEKKQRLHPISLSVILLSLKPSFASNLVNAPSPPLVSPFEANPYTALYCHSWR